MKRKTGSYKSTNKRLFVKSKPVLYIWLGCCLPVDLFAQGGENAIGALMTLYWILVGMGVVGFLLALLYLYVKREILFYLALAASGVFGFSFFIKFFEFPGFWNVIDILVALLNLSVYIAVFRKRW